jgi:hypothetical protein
MISRQGSVIILLSVLFVFCGRCSTIVSAQDAGWETRLSELDPARPVGYFELAEEISDAARTQEDLRIAGHLFALSGLLDRTHLGRSAALALADLAEDELIRRRLQLAAFRLSDAGGGRMETEAILEHSREGRLGFCLMLGAYRMGEGARARTYLSRADARAVLETMSSMMEGGRERIEREIELYLDGRRPRISGSRLEEQIAIEMLALSPTEMPWSTSLLLDKSRPLMVVDLRRMERLFGNVDVSKPYRRFGRWVDFKTVKELEITSD